jgi:hypothetical protein
VAQRLQVGRKIKKTQQEVSMIYSRVTESDFIDAFVQVGRNHGWTREALAALFEFLDEGIGEDYDLDVIALDSEFSYYEDLNEFKMDFGEEYESIEDVEAEGHVVIRVNGGEGGFIVQDF